MRPERCGEDGGWLRGGSLGAPVQRIPFPTRSPRRAQCCKLLLSPSSWQGEGVWHNRAGNNPRQPQLPIWKTNPSQTNFLKLEAEWSPVGRSQECFSSSKSPTRSGCGGVVVEKSERRVTPLGSPLTGALSRAGFNGGCGLRKLFAWSSEGCVDGRAAGSAVVCVPWCRRVGRGHHELVMLQPPPGFASVSISDSGRVRHGNWLFWRDKYSNRSQVDSSVEN